MVKEDIPKKHLQRFEMVQVTFLRKGAGVSPFTKDRRGCNKVLNGSECLKSIRARMGQCLKRIRAIKEMKSSRD